jgi:hypothetical protein
MADKRGFVRRNRGLFNSNTGPSHTNKKHILKQPDTDELCRRCGKDSETIQHITAACEQLAEAAELIDNKSPYYKYTPANVLENENVKLYWNRSILTDKTIPFNRPDITFTNRKTKNTFLIDTAVPNTQNLAKTITDKQNKTKNWQMKCVLCGNKRQPSDPDSNIIYGSNSKVTITKSNKT